MRIVHVNTEHTWRGGENQVFNLMLGLRKRGHQVEAVTLPDSALMRRCRDQGLDVFGLAMRSDADLLAAWRLARHLKNRPCDILHAQTARAHALALLARRFGTRARVVVSRRLDFPVKPNLGNRWKYRSRLVDAYIAVAGVIRDILIAAGVEPGKVAVINSSIDLSRFEGVGDRREEVRRELGLPLDALVIGNVAALAWHKGQKDLIAAMVPVMRSIPSAWLVIVGGGEEREALETAARQSGVAGRVVMTGARNDVPRLLTAFDVFCMSSYLEGLCNSVLEAFAMRLPVAATRAGGLPEIVEHERTGLLAEPRDPESLAAALVRLATDRELAARVGEAGQRLVRQGFGVDVMVDSTEALYSRLVREG